MQSVRIMRSWEPIHIKVPEEANEAKESVAGLERLQGDPKETVNEAVKASFSGDPGRCQE